MEKLASIMTDYLLSEKMIADDERDVYHYCIEVTLSILTYWLLILSCALAAGRLGESVVYVLAFMAMRLNVGGYHASTHFRCALLSLTAYLAFLFCLLYLPKAVIPLVCMASVALGGAVVIAFAPMAHLNKPFSDKERQKYRQGSLLVTGTLALAVGMSLALGYQVLPLCLSFAILEAALSLLAQVKHEHLTKGAASNKAA